MRLKTWFQMLLLLMVLVLVAACGSGADDQEADAGQDAEETETDSNESEEEEAASDKLDYDLAVIVKATDSDFWQTVLDGAVQAGEDYGVKVTTDGPPSEEDMQEQVSILENTITRGPDGILLASTSSDATVPAIEQAMADDLPIVLIDNQVETEEFVSFLATDNHAAGGVAADVFVEKLEQQGKELKGEVAVIGSTAGVQVVMTRIQGFLDRLAEIAPDITPIETRFTDNDIIKALNATEDILVSNPDVLGFYGMNNHTGIGVARAISEQGLEDEKVVIAFDSDPEEIDGLTSGAIDALIVQDPFGMGYKGIEALINHLNGDSVEKMVDTGATAVTMDNFEEDEIQKLLFPDKR